MFSNPSPWMGYTDNLTKDFNKTNDQKTKKIKKTNKYKQQKTEESKIELQKKIIKIERSLRKIQQKISDISNDLVKLDDFLSHIDPDDDNLDPSLLKDFNEMTILKLRQTKSLKRNKEIYENLLLDKKKYNKLLNNKSI